MFTCYFKVHETENVLAEEEKRKKKKKEKKPQIGSLVPTGVFVVVDFCFLFLNVFVCSLLILID